jgi:hypothetical protein
MQLDSTIGKELRLNLQEKIPYNDFDMKKVFYQKVKNYVNMFESSCLIRTSLWVAHNKFVSVYNILKKCWSNHCQFSETVQLFRKKEGDELFSAGVMYPDGQIFTKVKAIVDKGENKDGIYNFTQEQSQYKLGGEPFATVIDVEDNRWFMFLSESFSGEVHCQTLYDDKLYDVEGFQDPLNKNTNMVIVFAPDDDTVLLV